MMEVGVLNFYKLPGNHMGGTARILLKKKVLREVHR
jgi:hypothetical protein